jgi:hypothetical protein
MRALWADRRCATLTFAAICAGLFVFPTMMRWAAEYYISHPVVIPIWLRTAMLMSAIVRRIRLPITLIAALVLFVLSSRSQQFDSVRRSIRG